MVGALHRWYHQHARPLPWRETNDPYALWLSEIMLQQTQVGTVIAYYERFLMRFPAVQALADAPLEDVLKSWEGLGYYSRARNLHAAAGLMAQGGFPKTAEAWAALPGVGRSTAGALASFTVGEAAPVLDGNVQRVLCRLFSLDIPLPASGRELKELWSLAGELIRHGDPATHNQAMMELGATVCLPKNPQCPVCHRVMPSGQIDKMRKDLKAIDKDFVHLAINSTEGMTAEDSAKYLKKYKLFEELVVLDDAEGAVGKLYGAKTTPHMFVIDAKGVLRYTGALDNDPTGRNDERTNYVVNALRQIVAGETVSPEKTQSYGCEIKYRK